jgi:hypothetical protein
METHREDEEYSQHMKIEFSLETVETMKSPVAKIVVLLLGAAAVVLAVQIAHHII